MSSQLLCANTTTGNTYAGLFLRTGMVDYDPPAAAVAVAACPIKSLSPGYPPLRNPEEHHQLLRLAKFLSMLTHSHARGGADDTDWEYSIALGELWVRDALLSLAIAVDTTIDRDQLWMKAYPHYVSATKTIRHYLVQDLDEARLEQLLVASLFLGMVDFYHPHNAIFPLLHFEVVGNLLQALSRTRRTGPLSVQASRFHRIATENYIYHVAIESLYWPQVDRLPVLSESLLVDHSLEKPVITVAGATIYLVLFKLARLARLPEIEPGSRETVMELAAQVRRLDEVLSTPPATAVNDNDNGNPAQDRANPARDRGRLATSTLTILCTKLLDRTLLSTSATLRPLVQTALDHLDRCHPTRAFTGDLTWIFTILGCATSTPAECARLSAKVTEFSVGFWGSDLERMKKVFKLIHTMRAAVMRVPSSVGNGGSSSRSRNVITSTAPAPAPAVPAAPAPAHDPLDLLLGARLSMANL